MLLGIIYHASWMFTPAQYGAPVIDVGANNWMWFLEFWTHQFRMHAFFLIAGFFAALVCARRGWRAFAAQRARRIGIPFVVGWLFCYPITTFSYNWGAAVSGASMAELSPWKQTVQHFTNPSELMERYSLTHLWFLYTLLQISAATVIGLLLVKKLSGRREGWFTSWTNAAARFMQTPWSIVGLTLVTSAVNLPANWDVGPTPWKLTPPVSSFLTYWIYFLVGWLFHARPVLLETTDRRWKFWLASGSVISFGMFLFTVLTYNQGRLTDSNLYPGLDQSEFLDWEGFRADLRVDKNMDRATTFASRIWQKMSPPARQLMGSAHSSTMNQRVGFDTHLSYEILTLTNLPDGLNWKEVNLSAEANGLLAKPAAERSFNEALLLNRLLLEKSFPGRIAASTLGDPVFARLRVAYTGFYCLVGWLLTFGFLGLFRRYFSHPHATWRYFADSAYWLYIVHLPLLFLLEIPMATWEAPWLVKFALLNAVAFAILLSSYHFFVRSSIIGKTLNGRRYPFVRSFGRAGTTVPPEKPKAFINDV